MEISEFDTSFCAATLAAFAESKLVAEVNAADHEANFVECYIVREVAISIYNVRGKERSCAVITDFGTFLEVANEIIDDFCDDKLYAYQVKELARWLDIPQSYKLTKQEARDAIMKVFHDEFEIWTNQELPPTGKLAGISLHEDDGSEEEDEVEAEIEEEKEDDVEEEKTVGNDEEKGEANNDHVDVIRKEVPQGGGAEEKERSQEPFFMSQLKYFFPEHEDACLDKKDFERYAELGRGGNGRVFTGYNKKERCRVALKEALVGGHKSIFIELNLLW